jgi:hypothetical protein
VSGRDDLRQGIEKLLDEPEARRARETACRLAASGLATVGESLLMGGWLLRDDAARAVAVLTQIAGELAGSAVRLLDDGRTYGAAVLLRQLVEVEYLAYCFSRGKALAERWLTSPQEELRRMFQPAVMRRLAGGIFRDEEYWTHCELGGHPNPKARVLLPGRERAVDARWMWADLAQHLDRLWSLVMEAASVAGFEEALPTAECAAATESIAAWRQVDILATRLPLSVLQDDTV